MKLRMLTSLIALVFCGMIMKPAVAADLRSLTLELMATQSGKELREVAERSGEELRREQACEFQRRRRLPPTFCYRNALGNARETAKLDLLCVNQSRESAIIPKIDQFTSSTCREALEKRHRDLEYAAM